MTNVRKAAEPLRRMFDLAYASTEDLDARIGLLPAPLHVLYAQLKHLQQNEEEIKVELVGRIDDAQNFKQKKASEEEGEVVDEGAENNRRQQKAESEGTGGKRRVRRRRYTRNIHSESRSALVLRKFSSPISRNYTSSSCHRNRKMRNFSENCFQMTTGLRCRITPSPWWHPILRLTLRARHPTPSRTSGHKI